MSLCSLRYQPQLLNGSNNGGSRRRQSVAPRPPTKRYRTRSSITRQQHDKAAVAEPASLKKDDLDSVVVSEGSLESFSDFPNERGQGYSSINLAELLPEDSELVIGSRRRQSHRSSFLGPSFLGFGGLPAFVNDDDGYANPSTNYHDAVHEISLDDNITSSVSLSGSDASTMQQDEPIEGPGAKSFVRGDRVKITGGVHEGKTGTVKKVTALRVGVVMDKRAGDATSSKGAPRFLASSNLEKLQASADDSSAAIGGASSGGQPSADRDGSPVAQDQATSPLSSLDSMGPLIPATLDKSDDLERELFAAADDTPNHSVALLKIDTGTSALAGTSPTKLDSIESESDYTADGVSAGSQNGDYDIGRNDIDDDNDISSSVSSPTPDASTVRPDGHLLPGSVLLSSDPIERLAIETSTNTPISTKTFVGGDRVKITGGIHEGKTGTVKKVTALRVGVVMDEIVGDAASSKGAPRYLASHNLEKLQSSAEGSTAAASGQQAIATANADRAGSPVGQDQAPSPLSSLDSMEPLIPVSLDKSHDLERKFFAVAVDKPNRSLSFLKIDTGTTAETSPTTFDFIEGDNNSTADGADEGNQNGDDDESNFSRHDRDDDSGNTYTSCVSSPTPDVSTVPPVRALLPGSVPLSSDPIERLVIGTSTNTRIGTESFVGGDRVKITGGVHKGKTGTVKKVTAHRVGVVMDETVGDAASSKGTPRYLASHNLEKLQSSADGTAAATRGATSGGPGSAIFTDLAGSPVAQNRADIIEDAPSQTDVAQLPLPQSLPVESSDSPMAPTCVVPMANDGTCADFPDATDETHDTEDSTTRPIALHDVTNQPACVSEQNLAAAVQAPSVRERNEQGIFRHGDLVEVTGGTHRGRIATVVTSTKARVHVKINGLVEDKVRYLMHKNVRLQQASCLADPAVSSMQERASPETPGNRLTRSRPLPKTTRPGGASTRQKVTTRILRSSRRGTSEPGHAPSRLQREAKANSTERVHSFLGLREDSVTLIADGRLAQKERTLAYELFGERLRSIEIDISKEVKSLPSRTTDKDGSIYQLLSTKMLRKKGASLFDRTSLAKALYVLVNGGGMEPIDLKNELELFAGFGRLEPRKVAARLELLQTPAHVKDGDPLLSTLCPSELEEIPEIAHEGCGFMPVNFAQKYLGDHAVGKRTFALQVRIMSSQHGLFKGMLVAKPGISTIQLPSSMRKVGPSESPADHKAFMVIKGVFPSRTNSLHLAKLFAGKEPPKSFCPRKLSDMFCRVLRNRGVPLDVVAMYRDQSHGNRGQGLEHAFLIGLSDPTSAIPPGFIFITGVHKSPIKETAVVSRFPCTEALDAHKLPVLKSKPPGMSNEDWEWLCTLPFGGIMFANPSPGDSPMPSRIADGDLDGDLYLTCWHEPIVSHFELSTFSDASVCANSILDAVEPESPAWNENWLEQGQQLMGDVAKMGNMSALIGTLHKLWTSASEDGGGSSAAATAYGQAYKRALDIGKHGGQVLLPSHLWDDVPSRFHALLTADQNT